MAGYTRQSLAQILNGEIVSAPPLNAEFNQILSAFNNSTGHKHDGTAAEGPPIDRIADLDQNNLIFVDTSANQINFYVESSAASVGQISIQDGAIVPFTDNDIDLGSSSFEFKDLYIDGTANIDTLATSLIVAEAGTAGAPSITTTGDVDNGLYFNAANQMSYTSGGVAQVTFKDGSIVPVTDNDIDLGASGAEFKDLYIDGTANIDSLVADTVDINGGTIDNTVIGATTPAAATFTNLTVSTGSTINFSGATVSNGGTFTTVNISGGSITGITDLAIADGGTGASTASAARTNLGVALGTNVQAYDAGLQSISGLTTTADQMIYTTSSDTYATASLTSAGRALLDDADASAQRTTLGLGTLATQNANSVAITGGTISGISNLSDPGTSLQYTFSTTTTDSDPGSGLVRLNNATQNAATEIYIDDEDSDGTDVSGVIGLLSGGNNPSSVLGYVTIRKEFAPENFITMKITTLTSASGYTKLVGTVEASSGATPFSDTDNLYFSIDVSGDKGDPGDLSGPASSTDNAVIRWDGTSGKTAQNSSVTIDDSGNVTTAGRIHSTTTGFRFPDNTDQTTAGVIGPASSTDNAVVRWDGTSGGLIQDSSVVIDDSGNVGIGTSSPSSKLQVNGEIVTNSGLPSGDISAPAASFFYDTSNDYATITSLHNAVAWKPFAIRSAGMIFRTSSDTEAMRIDSSGNVGIGTSSPGSILELASTGPVLTLNDTNGVVGGSQTSRISFEASGTETGTIGIASGAGFMAVNNKSGSLALLADSNNTSTSSTMTFSVDGTEAARINSSGNVGIGTTSPAYPLDVAGIIRSSSTFPSLYLNETDQAVDEKLWRISSAGKQFSIQTANDAVSAARSSYSISRGTGTAIGDHVWVSGTTEAMRLTSSGNVGIGTTSPDFPLDVAGRIGILEGTNGIAFHDGSGSVSGAVRADSGDNLIFATGSSDTERMRINSSGNVGIGGTPAEKLDVIAPDNSSIIMARVTRSSKDYGIALENNGSTGDSTINAFGSGAELIFETASTEQARFDANGLRIGTTAEVVTATGGELVSLQGTATKSPLGVKSSDVTSIHSWNTGSSAATRYHFIGWNPAGSQEFHLRRETDGSIRLASLVAGLQLDGNSNGISFKDSVTFEDNVVSRPILKDYAETTVIANTGTTYTIDLENGNVFNLTLTGNCTYTFSNPPASGSAGAFTLIQNQDGTGSRTVTWPASVEWAGGSAPTITSTASSTDVFTFITTDGGTTWYGFTGGQDFS
jgi:hypothetical protein